jgi:hypothetical protein
MSDSKDTSITIEQSGSNRTNAGGFSATHWSVVLAAGQNHDARAAAALERLCRSY